MLVIAITIIPAFTMSIGYLWPLVGTFVSSSRIAITFAFFFFFLTDKKLQKQLNNICFLLLLLLYIYINICTAIKQPQNIVYSLQLVSYGFIPFAIIFLSATWGTSKQTICKGISLALNILVIINLFLMIIFPHGIYSTASSGTVTPYYLFGSKNQMVAPILTCLFFEVEKSTYSKTRISNIVIYCICIIELIIGGSGTGLVLLFFFIIFSTLHTAHRPMPLLFSLLVVVLAYICLVILRVQELFSYIIINVLHKSLTLSNRTIIWDSAIDAIKSNPLIGNGPTESLAANVHIQLSYTERDTFAHNLLLDYLLMGGIIAGLLFCCIIFFTYRQYSTYVSIHHHLSFIWWGIITYLLASIVEIYQGQFCLFLMISYLLVFCKDSKYHIHRKEICHVK